MNSLSLVLLFVTYKSLNYSFRRMTFTLSLVLSRIFTNFHSMKGCLRILPLLPSSTVKLDCKQLIRTIKSFNCSLSNISPSFNCLPVTSWGIFSWSQRSSLCSYQSLAYSFTAHDVSTHWLRRNQAELYPTVPCGSAISNCSFCFFCSLLQLFSCFFWSLGLQVISTSDVTLSFVYISFLQAGCIPLPFSLQ